jgi:hypothetical protein
MEKLLDLVTDPYERKARVTPSLLVVLPILIPLVCQFGAKNATLTAILSLIGGCGVVYAGASISRGRGKKIEEKLVRQWGGLPSTIVLRHRDTFFDSVTKRRYHADCGSKLGIKMPTTEEEFSDPTAADDIYLGVGRRLRELTREDKKLLLKENIAYGFHRNMLAMKDIGVFLSVCGLIYGLVLAQFVTLKPVGLNPSSLLDPGLPAVITLLFSILMLVAWLTYFNADQVRRMGFVYAERLFERLSSLPKLRAKAVSKGFDTNVQEA